MKVPTFASLLTLCAGFTLSGASPLVDFQVAQPPPVPTNVKECTVQILQRDFAFSFGMAEVVQFTPPTDCGPAGSWSAVTLNFTVTSNGTQFDRLGIFTFQNVEIWRTSTPEPTRGDGIIWTYIKDVTRYIPLFAKPGTFILQLDNLIQPGLDGVYSTVLHATFFASTPAHPPAPKSDLIIPISSLRNDTGNDVSVPPAFSLNVTFPRNTVKVFAELYASGNGNEEFWYFNLANQFLNDVPAGTTFGQGPFREVRILVDGNVAGAAYPYAVYFTGAITPSSWRPISSYGALDLPTYFLDLTPFVPLLTDGQAHTFSLDVASAESDHTINQNWFLSGALQVFLDPSSKPTTGKMTLYSVDPFSDATTQGTLAPNGDLQVTVATTRNVHIESTIVGGSGSVNKVVFQQALAYSNTQTYLNNASTQNVFQTASGSVSSTHNGVPVLIDNFEYPMTINLTVLDPAQTQFSALFDHSYKRDFLPLPILPRMNIDNHQIATGFIQLASTGNTGNGTNSNVFSYSDSRGNTFGRTVDAVLNNITVDHQTGSLARLPTGAGPQHPFSLPSNVGGSPRLPGARKIPVPQ